MSRISFYYKLIRLDHSSNENGGIFAPSEDIDGDLIIHRKDAEWFGPGKDVPEGWVQIPEISLG